MSTDRQTNRRQTDRPGSRGGPTRGGPAKNLLSRRRSYLGKKILSTRISKMFLIFPMDRKVRMKRNVNPPTVLMLKIFQGQNFVWLLYKSKQMKILKERS